MPHVALLILLNLGAGDTADGGKFFTENIQPVLTEHCYQCHSEEARKQGKLKGGLLLDSQAGLARGGEQGAIVVAGNPDESRLILALRYTQDDFKMPPKARLPDEVIEKFEKWIELGAPDPRPESP